MPRGKKTCPSCKALVGARIKHCCCGHEFLPTVKKVAKPHFKERRGFIKRMLGNSKASDWRLEMTVATKIFKDFKDDLNFLSKVKPPFELKGSIKYFLTKDGKEYLRKKHKEFYFKTPEKDKFVDTKEKAGEDIMEHKTKTLRDFLYE